MEFMAPRLLTWTIIWMIIPLSGKGDKVKDANQDEGGEGGELVSSLLMS